MKISICTKIFSFLAFFTLWNTTVVESTHNKLKTYTKKGFSGLIQESEGSFRYVRLIARVWTCKNLGIFSIYVNHGKPEIPNRYLKFTQLPKFEYITDFLNRQYMGILSR